MSPQNKKFLEDNYHHYLTVKDGYVKGLNAAEREGMQRVMAEEFAPGYSTDLWCGPCVFEMVKLLYTRYEQWKAQQPIESVRATFPKAEPPLQGGISEVSKKSNKHKHHHRK